MPHTVTVIGPRDLRGYRPDEYISTVSHASDWSRGLSPFVLGPCPLYGELRSLTMENAWQYLKAYPPAHIGPDGEPTAAYWRWAEEGWANPRAVRYPMGKGAVPAYSYWDGERLDYVSARQRVYFPLYRDAVRQGVAWHRLKSLHAERDLVLFDFDGYDHDRLGVSLADVLADPTRKCGHAFVLKAMLLLGEDATPEAVREQLASRPVPAQPSLFG